MKKLFGLLVIGTVGMFIACSSDDSNSNPYQPGLSDALTPADCANMGMVLNIDPNTGKTFCAQPAATATSSSDAAAPTSAADPASSNGGFTPGPVAVSSSDVVAPVASSSSVAVAPAVSSSSAATPATPASSATPTPKSSAVAEPEVMAFGLWDGAEGGNQVPTGSKKGGYWYSYTDTGNKGESTLDWNSEVAVGSTYSDDDLSPVIKDCGGLCGKFNLVAGGNEDCAPYVAVAFDISDGKTGSDMTSSKGICITYTSTVPAEVDLGLGSKDATYGYNNPAFILPKAASATTVDIGWSEFEQQWESAKAIDGPTAASMLVAIKIQFKGSEVGEDAGEGSFLISKFGAAGQCD